MKRFKGTKGEWSLCTRFDEYDTPSFSISSREGKIVNCYNLQIADGVQMRAKANAQLISKAPEMLEELIETTKDLNVLLSNIYEANKKDSRWDGMYQLVLEWKNRIDKLIKEAIEL